MKAKVIKFPRRFLPAVHRTEKCPVIKLPIVRIERECPKVQELRRQSKRLREYFKPKRRGDA